jgi:hypothetical protein
MPDDVWQDIATDVWQDILTDVWQDEEDVTGAGTAINQHQKGLLLHVY